MDTHYLYLAINIGSVFVPFLASFYPKHAFYKHWKSYFIANSIVALFFIVWDMLFTHIGVWGFNYKYLLGIKIYNLPIEEIMFFFFIPYSSAFIWYSMLYLVKKCPLENYHKAITTFLLGFSFVVAIINYERFYTFYTSLFFFIFLAVIYWKKVNMGYIYFGYIITLLPFLIVNGILTGSWIDEPVVWYNNNENLGKRIATIPVEDAFYGFVMVAATIVLFQSIEKKPLLAR
ncbi:lycopene cyclase domain-containing protein [Flavobacterium croceum DSM 17960]|uniref:Lycopene cyclase domain-containing protein n=1 Tax=Flavobacterium croceum DSM 17960 TaxID=1121886 RepID=A0A2S4N9F3_9FLAO|nr:lycopene cyclase domain-containing protein [Flavobacterium croceum]POS02310.1 lycopene cyclase domain-containing protein [Flavobacterium croceum DSM 17960]